MSSDQRDPDELIPLAGQMLPRREVRRILAREAEEAEADHVDYDADIELSTADGAALELTPAEFAVIAPEDAESIGELYARLPPGEWVELPQFGVRVKRWAE